MPVTLSDIARRARVSKFTVSTVLSGRSTPKRRDALQRAQRIHRIAAEMGYRPNAAARATSSGRFAAAGLLLSAARRVSSNLPQELIAGLCAALEAHGMHLSLAMLSDEQLVDDATMPRLLREWCVDGLLINYTQHTPEGMADLIDRLRVPAVWLNCKRAYNCVRPDDFDAGSRAARHLLDCGHRRIAYVRFSLPPEFSVQAHCSEADRRDGYIAAMVDAGLTPWVFDAVPDGRIGALQRMEAMLSGPDRPTAVLAYGRLDLAQVLMSVMRRGLRVPEDISVAVFADEPIFMDKPILTWLVPQARMGSVAVDELTQLLASPKRHRGTVTVPFTLHAGGSVAAPA
jgi:LacI family transcriptional regulator